MARATALSPRLFLLALLTFLAAARADWSDLSCTAEDVRLIGPGVVLNQPCDCVPGMTFNATVQFLIYNNAAADRYCLTFDLCPAVLSDGTTVTIFPDPFRPGAIISGTFNYTITIAGYPCDAGTVCFGSSPDSTGKCPTGTCCDTLAWDTNTQGDCGITKPIPGQCRHQEVCITTPGAFLTCTAGCEPCTTSPTTNLTLCAENITGTITSFELVNSLGGSFEPIAEDGSCAFFSVPVTGRAVVYNGTILSDSCPGFGFRDNLLVNTTNFCTGLDCHNGTCDCLLQQCNCTPGFTTGPNGEPCFQNCGNGIVEGSEECDNASDPCCNNTVCKFVTPGTPCPDNNACTIDTCQRVSPTSITCVHQPVTNGISCTLSHNITNQCHQATCQSGVCSETFKPVQTPCSAPLLSSCQFAECNQQGNCQVHNDQVGTLCFDITVDDPQCQVAECDSFGMCVPFDLEDFTPCNETAPPPQCQTSACVNGTCTFVPDHQGQPCMFMGSQQLDCQEAICDQGQCVLRAINENQPCFSLPDIQCNNRVCHNGACSYDFWQQGTACTGVSADSQCAVTQCDGQGQCLGYDKNTGQTCSGTGSFSPNCVQYQCANQGCTAVPLADGTFCNDTDLCTLDTCSAGVCQHTAAQQCDQPPGPCSEPTGTCAPSTGQCVYQGLGQGQSCQPTQQEIQSGCSATQPGNYVCQNPQADSPCVPNCPVLSTIIFAGTTGATDATTDPPAASGASNGGSSHASAGAIAGATIGAVVALAGALAGAAWWVRRQRQQNPVGEPASSHADGQGAAGENNPAYQGHGQEGSNPLYNNV